jgi:hypothetical protein
MSFYVCFDWCFLGLFKFISDYLPYFEKINTVDSHCLEFGWLEFPVESNFYRSPELRCVKNIYNLTPVESNSDESKFLLSRIKVLVPRCRKPYYLHSFSQIYLSKHVYYLGIKIGSQVKHPVIEFDIFTLGYFTCLFHNLSN